MRFTMVLAEIRRDFPGFSGYYSEGAASLAAVLKERGNEFSLIHLTRPQSARRVADLVAASRPDVIGYSCMSHTFGYVAEYAAAIRQRLPHVPSIIGGVHATLHPDECLATPGIDAACTGEGEIPLPLFLDALARSGSRGNGAMRENLREQIPGIRTCVDGDGRPAPASPVVMDLDSLPFPDRSIFGGKELMSSREHVLYAFASRGCPFDCSFCCNDALRSHLPAETPAMRMKSPSRVCAEILRSDEYTSGKLMGIYFQDDLFPLSASWLRDFAREYAETVGIPFNCNLRADVVTEERTSFLREAGCVSVSIGVESGNESMRAGLLGKKITDAEFHRAFSLLQRAGIRINTFSMVGLPGETAGDAIETVCMNSHAAVNRPLCSIFYPYVGTALYDRCASEGLLTGRSSDTYGEVSVLRQSTITSRQVEFLHDFFALLVAGVRKFGRESGAMKAVFTLIRRDSFLLGPLTAAYRGLRKPAIWLYLAAGRVVANRQARVFTTRPSPGTGGRAW
jgi:anaerobic magnesium-protoporphyrin IX monomethyl ester cyclase